jgi:hypothetical protein
MFNFLKSTKVEIMLKLDKPDGVYFPGENVDITVDITPAEDLKLKNAYVRLVGTELYWYRSYDTNDIESSREIDIWGEEVLFVNEETILGETVLSKDVCQHFSLQMQLPSDALPSFNASILRVAWKIEVKIDRHLAKDIHAESGLQVRLQGERHPAQPGEYDQFDQPEEAKMTFRLPGLDMEAGEALSGELCILPHKDFEGQPRVELVRNEGVSREQGNYGGDKIVAELAGNTHFIGGQPQTFLFQLVIPADVPPTIQTPHGAINWVMRGVIDRRLHPDIAVVQNVVVYPAR